MGTANILASLAGGFMDESDKQRKIAFDQDNERRKQTLGLYGELISRPDIDPTVKDDLVKRMQGIITTPTGKKWSQHADLATMPINKPPAPPSMGRAASSSPAGIAVLPPPPTQSQGVQPPTGAAAPTPAIQQPAPPPTTMFMSPDAIAARDAHLANAKEVAVRAERTKNVQNDPTLSKLDDASKQEYILTGSVKSKLQQKILEGADGNPVAATFDPQTGQYHDGAGNPIVNPKPYTKGANINVLEGLRQKLQTAFETNDTQGVTRLQNEIKALDPVGQQRTAVTVNNQNSNKLENSYKFHTDKLITMGKPVQDRAERLGRLVTSLDAGTPVADSLIAPELLTAMAGGQGSGLRMNEAEISRIVGGRSHWEDLKAALNKWQTDPSKALSITPDQRAQMNTLVRAMNTKVQSKLQILNDTQEAFVNADTPMDHKKAFLNAEKKLSAVDMGNSVQTPAPPPASLPDAARARLKEGIHTKFANGEEWTLQGGQPVRLN